MLDTPSAWNDVRVGPFSDYDQSCDVSSRMDEWLSRSGDPLISLGLGTLMEARLRTTQDLLHKYRFKKLRMINPAESTIHTLSDTCGKSSPCRRAQSTSRSYRGKVLPSERLQQPQARKATILSDSRISPAQSPSILQSMTLCTHFRGASCADWTSTQICRLDRV